MIFISRPYKLPKGLRENILVVSGGGTITMKKYIERTLEPSESGRKVIEQYFPGFRVVESINLDSTNVGYPEFMTLSEPIMHGLQEGMGVVATVGSDGFGSIGSNGQARIRNIKRGNRRGVVFVASMSPMGMKHSDAPYSMHAAVLVANDGERYPGVNACINAGEVHRPARLMKMQTTELKDYHIGATVPMERPFEPIFYPKIGQLSIRPWWEFWNIRNPKYSVPYDRTPIYNTSGAELQWGFRKLSKSRETLEGLIAELFGHEKDEPFLLTEYAPVYVADLHANYNPELLEHVLERGYEAAVLLGSGTGGVRNLVYDSPGVVSERAVIPRIKKWRDKGKLVFITSIVPKSIVDPLQYGVNLDAIAAGAIPCGDMSTNFLVTLTELVGGIKKRANLTPYEAEHLFWDIAISEHGVNPVFMADFTINYDDVLKIYDKLASSRKSEIPPP